MVSTGFYKPKFNKFSYFSNTKKGVQSMHKKYMGLLCLVPFMLSACGEKADASCSSASAQELVSKILNEEAEKAAAEQKSTDGNSVFDISKVRSTLSQFKISIENIRTTKKDPDSTKQFCAGDLKVVVPVDVLSAAGKGRELAGANSVLQFVQDSGFELSANSLKKGIEYNVQPTDDKKKVFVELDNAKMLGAAVSGVAQSALLKPILEARKNEADAQAKAQQQEHDQQMQAQRQAALEQAKADNALANQAITELWKSIPEENRKILLEQQRAWIKKKDVDCRLEAASKTTDPTEKETLRLNCDTTATGQRINALRQN